MRTIHFALLVLCGAAGLIFVSAGCASKKNTPPVAESQERELSRRTAMNVRTDASLPREGSGGDAGADATQPVDTAHLLANRTASYSKELDDLISKRAAKTQAAAGAAADPKASAVQWEGTDPQTRGASSSTQQPEQSPTKTVKPVMDASSSPKSVTSSPAVANRNAAVGSSKPNI